MLQLLHFVTLCDPACVAVAVSSSCTEPHRPASRCTVLVYLPSCYTQKYKKCNLILGNWPQPCNNRQKFCVYLTLSTSIVRDQRAFSVFSFAHHPTPSSPSDHNIPTNNLSAFYPWTFSVYFLPWIWRNQVWHPHKSNTQNNSSFYFYLFFCT
jgi:hypothetical protein